MFLRQGRGLVGDHGLMPAAQYVAEQSVGGRWAAARLEPAIFWLDASNGALMATAVVGALLSLAVVAGVTNAGVMAALWALDLSIVPVGQTFWGFGWEILLLEAGFLAIFLCP